MLNANPDLGSRQRGVALVAALVFLTLLTILGVTSLGTSALEEKLANNTQDRNYAFQAAEAALERAEAWIESQPSEPLPWPETNKGKHNPSLTTPPGPVWKTVSWSGTEVIVYPCTPTLASGCGGGLPRVGTQPKYVIERMGVVQAGPPTRIAYRITARGTGSTDAAVVMLQSVYVKEFP